MTSPDTLEPASPTPADDEQVEHRLLSPYAGEVTVPARPRPVGGALGEMLAQADQVRTSAVSQEPGTLQSPDAAEAPEIPEGPAGGEHTESAAGLGAAGAAEIPEGPAGGEHTESAAGLGAAGAAETPEGPADGEHTESAAGPGAAGAAETPEGPADGEHTESAAGPDAAGAAETPDAASEDGTADPGSVGTARAPEAPEDAGTAPTTGPASVREDATVEDEHVIEAADPRDFVDDDGGPDYQDEDFDEPVGEDAADVTRTLSAPTQDHDDFPEEPDDDAEPDEDLAPPADDGAHLNLRRAFPGGGALVVPGRPRSHHAAPPVAPGFSSDGSSAPAVDAFAPTAPLAAPAPAVPLPATSAPATGGAAPTAPASSPAASPSRALVSPGAPGTAQAPCPRPGGAGVSPGAPGTATDQPAAGAPAAAPSSGGVGPDGTGAAVPIGTTRPAPEAELPPLESFTERFTDRELTWLDFNERVLEQAEDPDLPLLERAWFLSIFSSNLDEFYMVRVAGLKRRIAAGITPVRASGMDAHEVMERITVRAKDLTARQAALFQEVVRPALAGHGIEILGWGDLTDEQRERLTRYFRHQIYPVLTPLAVDPSHPFPYISGLSLNLAVILRNPRSGKEHFARIKLPQSLPRLITVPGRELSAAAKDRGTAVVPLEVVIAQHLDHLFPGMEILEHHLFRITRNENLEVEEDDAENLLTAMEKELERRRFGALVRLEVEDTISPFVRRYLVRELGITADDVFELPAPLDLKCLNQLHDLDVPDLKYPRFVPVTAAGLAAHESSSAGDVFASVREHDVLLHHPYDAFSTSVQEFIAQAAADPKVLAIKQTLYRTSGDSPIIDALIEAAEAGKQVVAIVEIKARFDEEANITWARKLERAGVHVVYGMVGLKTHSKLILVVRQEPDGLRRYCHVGTGNYHPKTARGYEDLGLLTCDRDVAQDLTTLFNQLSGYAPRARFRRLLVAPRSLRDGLVERIEREIANRAEGKEAWIRIKVNSIIDETLIDALYRASRAGVDVDIVVRGICGLRAGVPGLSDHIRVRSILGRYLEHSRVYAFAGGGDTEVWIGSADLMHRNLDRRVEALVRIVDPQMVKDLTWLVTHAVSDEVSSWWMEPDGSWTRHVTGPDGARLEDIQTTLMARARSRVAGGR